LQEDSRKFLTPKPHSVGSDASSLQLKEFYDEACKLKEDGAYNDALKKLGELISIRDDYVNAYIVRGRIYLENLQQYQNALEDFRQVLKIEPNNKYALFDLGLTYYYLGDLSMAIEWNQKAMDQDPDLIIAIYNHAIYHVDYGAKYNVDSSYREAIELYENVKGRDREFAVSAMFNLAALYARLAEQESNKTTKDQYIKEAVALLDGAIEKDREKGLEQGLERLKKVTGEIYVPYCKDLKTIYEDPDYQRMIEKWRDDFTK
jgi:tetratricopeptide (TPR) repeat protein